MPELDAWEPVVRLAAAFGVGLRRGNPPPGRKGNWTARAGGGQVRIARVPLATVEHAGKRHLLGPSTGRNHRLGLWNTPYRWPVTLARGRPRGLKAPSVFRCSAGPPADLESSSDHAALTAATYRSSWRRQSTGRESCAIPSRMRGCSHHTCERARRNCSSRRLCRRRSSVGGILRTQSRVRRWPMR